MDASRQVAGFNSSFVSLLCSTHAAAVACEISTLDAVLLMYLRDCLVGVWQAPTVTVRRLMQQTCSRKSLSDTVTVRRLMQQTCSRKSLSDTVTVRRLMQQTCSRHSLSDPGMEGTALLMPSPSFTGLRSRIDGSYKEVGAEQVRRRFNLNLIQARIHLPPRLRSQAKPVPVQCCPGPLQWHL